MAAAQRQLIDAILHQQKGKNLKVLHVLPSEHGKEDADFVRVAHESQLQVETIHGAAALFNHEHQHPFNAVVVDNVLAEGKVLDRLDDLMKATLQLLLEGGTLLIREDLSSFGDTKKIAKLTDFFDVYRLHEADHSWGFNFYALLPVQASIYARQNWQDVFWTLTKAKFEKPKEGELLTFRDFLDRTQYTDDGILTYEFIFGEHFISPGGAQENLKFLRRFGNLQPGQTLLDIGVGIGGGARQAAAEFGLLVTGVDLSSNMLCIALDRVHRDKDTRVQYAICNALTYDFPADTFDYVYSRDAIHHNEDMDTFFKRIYQVIRPGGQLLITMYGTGYGKWTEKFAEYVKQRQYHLKTNEQIQKSAEAAGFTNVRTESMNERFKEILGEERSYLDQHKAEFLKRFSQKAYDKLVVGWTDKLGYIADDNHRWNLVHAVKPATQH